MTEGVAANLGFLTGTITCKEGRWRHTGQVGEDIVGDDERAGQQEPDDAVEDVGHEEGGGDEDKEQDEVRPRVLPKLVQVAPLLQLQHERHETCAASRQVTGLSVFNIVMLSTKRTLCMAAPGALLSSEPSGSW